MNEKLEKARQELLEINELINAVDCTAKVKRIILQTKYGFTKEMADEILPPEQDELNY